MIDVSGQKPPEERHSVASSRFVGKTVEFENEGVGKITDETEDSIFIESPVFTGWMLKTEYFELLGIEE